AHRSRQRGGSARPRHRLRQPRLLRPGRPRPGRLPGARAARPGDPRPRGNGGRPTRARSAPSLTETDMSTIEAINDLLGADGRALLEYRCKGIPQDTLHLPGPDIVDRVWSVSDRPTPVLRSLQALVGHGRLAGTGYLSILPVDQGIEHSAGASFAKNPAYFDPENIVKLAIEGGCNAVASTLGVLGTVARKYAHKIPFLMKFNHNEFLTYPNKFDQIFFASVKQARDMGAVAVGATIYFGSEQSSRQIIEVGQAFQIAHEMGM